MRTVGGRRCCGSYRIRSGGSPCAGGPWRPRGRTRGRTALGDTRRVSQGAGTGIESTSSGSGRRRHSGGPSQGVGRAAGSRVPERLSGAIASEGRIAGCAVIINRQSTAGRPTGVGLYTLGLVRALRRLPGLEVERFPSRWLMNLTALARRARSAHGGAADSSARPQLASTTDGTVAPRRRGTSAAPLPRRLCPDSAGTSITSRTSFRCRATCRP